MNKTTKRKKALDSLSTVWTLIMLQFKAGVKLSREKTPVKSALKITMLLAGGLVLLGGFVAVYYMLSTQFVPQRGALVDLRHEFLTFTLAGFQLLQTLFLIPMLIKVLDLSNDRELLLRMPVSPRHILISKLAVAYIYEIIFAAAILLPILIAYGLACSMNFVFYLLIPVLILFVPVLPFCLVALLMFPIIKIIRFLKNRSSLTMLLYLGGLVLLIVFYMNIVHGAVFAIADKGFAGVLQEHAESITKASRFIYPSKFFVNLLSLAWHVALLNAFGMLLSSAAMIALAILVAGAAYKKIYMEERSRRSNGERSSMLKTCKPQTAVLFKDTANIFRSSNYTFQFLLVALMTPLLVYFCNRTAAYSVYQSFDKVGQIDSSQQMIFGVSVLVTMILMPLACSFAASNISREGYNFYHTKLIPLSFRKQLAIKSAIVFVPILLSAALSAFVTMLEYRLNETQTILGLSATEALIVFALCALMSIGYICLGTYLDLRRPVCNQIGEGELTKTTSTVNFIMLFGLAIGAGFGVLGMFGGFSETFFNVSFTARHIKIIYLCFSAVFALASTVLMFVDGPKKYCALEQ